MSTKSTLPPRPKGRNETPAPAHLEDPERTLWREILATYTFDDAAALALLRTALEAHQRARRCRQAIDKDGETFRDRFGQVKAHPLLAAERDARAAWIAGIRTLNLDLPT